MAAIGLRARTGKAELLALDAGPRFVARAHLVLSEPAARHCYHVAAEMTLARAERHVKAALADATERATAAIDAAIRGTGITRAGLVRGKSRGLPPLEKILPVHAMLHAAEGELYRDALEAACAQLGLTVVGVPAPELSAAAAGALGITDARLRDRLAQLGVDAGRPWTVEQKEAAMAAMVALR